MVSGGKGDDFKFPRLAFCYLNAASVVLELRLRKIGFEFSNGAGGKRVRRSERSKMISYVCF